MNEFNQKYIIELSKTTKVIKKSYLVALLILALISIGNYFVLSAVTQAQFKVSELRTEVIKHEFLYRRIKELITLTLHQSETNAKTSLYKLTWLELNGLTKKLRQNRINIEKVCLLPRSTLSAWAGFPEIISDSTTILPVHSKEVESQLKEFLSLESSTIKWHFSIWSPLALKLVDRGVIMENIKKTIKELNYKSTDITQRSVTVHQILIFSTLLTLLLEYFFIFHPLLQRLSLDYKEIKAANAKLQYQATHDDMTGVGNRRLFIETLKQEKNAPFTVFIIDPSDFKNINDLHGNDIGDHVLNIISSRLKDIAPNASCHFRYGGDQFVIIAFDLDGTPQVEQFANQIISDIAKPIKIKGKVILMRCAIGINRLEPQKKAIDIQQVLKELNFSLRTAKESEQLRFNIFTAVESGKKFSKAQLSARMSDALNNGEICPFYQPIINIETGDIIGAEALARWVSKEGIVTSPAEFLPLIEELNLMNNLTEIILQQVCSDHKQLVAAGMHSKFISVNFPESVLADPELPMKVNHLLGSTNLNYLHIELLETALLHESSYIIKTNLQALIELGAHISMDDFGTGYASLSHLLDFPCHTVKIDRCFVANIPGDSGSQLITRGIIDIALGLGISIIAEGIETKEQSKFFSEWTEIAGQGYLFYRPQPFSDFINLLERK